MNDTPKPHTPELTISPALPNITRKQSCLVQSLSACSALLRSVSKNAGAVFGEVSW
ncbi:hypothetical protein BDR03DRAFT_938739 [Suillus americanus]|nr:hypothetical protein BDR03DRAFT_938739 [Suillus americanus]